MLGVFYYFNIINGTSHEFTYDEFMEKLDSGKIKKLEVTTKGNGHVYEVVGTLDNYKEALKTIKDNHLTLLFEDL